MPPFHSESAPVRFGELDAAGRLSLRALCERLQDAAAAGATALGVSMPALAGRGLAWVLHELRIELRRPPLLGEPLEVLTWPRAFDRLLAERDFELAVAGEPVASATSRWAIVDLAERRAVRMPEDVRALPVAARRAALDPPLARQRRIEAATGERRFGVRRSDLDSVGHVNHTRYVDWVVESVPDAVWDACRVARLEITFSREVRRGQEIVSRAQRLPGRTERFAHELRDDEDRLIAGAATSWEPATKAVPSPRREG